jgi:hypothetical protein
MLKSLEICKNLNAIVMVWKGDQACHSERSEASQGAASQMLRCAQNDRLNDLVRRTT